MDRHTLRIARPLASFLALIPLTSACAKIIGADFDEARLEPQKSHDASLERQAVPEASTCDPLVPPARPTHFAPATDAIEFTVVVRKVDFGDYAPDGGTPGYFTTGYDLDGLCSKENGPAPCAPQPWIGGFHADGPRGQDDAVALLMLNQASTFGVSAIGSSVVNKAVEAGRDAPLAVIRVRAFGGLGEDDHVEVDWFVASTLSSAGDGGTDAGVAPRFDTSDHWPILSTSVVDPTVTQPKDMVSLYRDAQAFVTLTTLVARFPRVVIPLSNVYFELTGVKLTALVHRVDRNWQLDDVVFSGSASTNGLLGVVPQIAHILFGVTFCTDDLANYPKVKRFLCESSDLPAAPNDPPSSRCVLTSTGARMETSPASLGSIVDPAPLPAPCLPATDPRNDSCDIPAADD